MNIFRKKEIGLLYYLVKINIVDISFAKFAYYQWLGYTLFYAAIYKAVSFITRSAAFDLIIFVIMALQCKNYVKKKKKDRYRYS